MVDGWDSHVLKLNKNLYSVKQASHNWFVVLTHGLKYKGFVVSKATPYVFFKEDMIVLVYIDGMIVVTKE